MFATFSPEFASAYLTPFLLAAFFAWFVTFHQGKGMRGLTRAGVHVRGRAKFKESFIYIHDLITRIPNQFIHKSGLFLMLAHTKTNVVLSQNIFYKLFQLAQGLLK